MVSRYNTALTLTCVELPGGTGELGDADGADEVPEELRDAVEDGELRGIVEEVRKRGPVELPD
jgi:hypothetical protein